MTFSRMNFRHAGTMTRATTIASANFVRWGVRVRLATAATPPSKECSQEKPTVRLRASMPLKMRAVTCASSRVPRALAASASVSRPPMAAREQRESTRARMMRPPMESGPPIWPKTCDLKACQRAAQRRHHAKTISPCVSTICSSRLSPGLLLSVGPSSTKKSISEQAPTAQPIITRPRTAPTGCSYSGCSWPEMVGSWPVSQ
mmetsp:Transcript_94954/g.306578  ORF Transcript_94954/g.306578 Transcript_94954/m.306578 type:complete len:203 (+) Transcript_94954:166-774(+)